MKYIKREILEASQLNNINIQLIAEEAISVIREKIVQNYTLGYHNRDIVQMFKDEIWIHDRNGWYILTEIVASTEQIVLFFNEDDEREGFLVNTPSELESILANTFHFEFYITDLDTTYIMCFNHHDVLIGAGRAHQWISLYLENTQP